MPKNIEIQLQIHLLLLFLTSVKCGKGVCITGPSIQGSSFYARGNNNKVDSIETGRIVIALLFS